MNDIIITEDWIRKMDEVLEGFQDWFWDGKIPRDLGGGFGQCICGKKHIRYEYTIIHRFAQKKLIVGSTCYLKFIHHTLGLSYDEIKEEMRILENKATYFYRKQIFQECIETASMFDTFVQSSVYRMMQYFEQSDGFIRLKHLVVLSIALKKHKLYEKMKIFKVNFQSKEERIYLANLKPFTYEVIKPILESNGQGDYYEKYRNEFLKN